METILESESSGSSHRPGAGEHGADISDGNESFCEAKEKDIRRRTAMGEYIVPKGGMPLTQLALPAPGPADYAPKWGLTEHSTPEYSIVGRTKRVKPSPVPGSADYNTSGDLVWNNPRKKTLKAKLKTQPYGVPPAYQVTPSLGPANYKVLYTDTGKHAPKISCASRHLDGVNVGHPNSLVQPVDTHGLQTPGPNEYAPSTEDRGHIKSFGSSRKTVSDTLGPGPAGYTIEEPEMGAQFSLAKRLKARWQQVDNNPAPNSYDLGTTIGKGVSKSLGARRPSLEKNWVPSPNTYILRDPIKRCKPTALVTYRPFEHTLKTEPSPAHYMPSGKNLHSAPDFSCRKPCKPCFPDILKYPAQALDSTPAPGTYHNSGKKFTDNYAPAYSMGKRRRSAKNDVPGPNHYNIRVTHRPDGKKAPEFSMGSRSFPPNKNEFYKNENPPPTAYDRSLDTNSGIKYSMTKRRDMHTKSSTPAANAYTIDKGQTAKGVFTGPRATLKGRGTAYVYAGYALQSSVRLFDA